MSVKILSIILGLLFSSCVKDVDFNQANQFKFKPNIALPLVNFSLEQPSLVEKIPNSGLSFTYTSSFKTLEELNKGGDLKQVDLEVELNNPFNREFVLNIRLLDNNGSVIYAHKTLNVSVNSVLKNTESIIIADHPNILKSTQLIMILEMLPSATGVVIDPKDPKTLTFKSGGIFRYIIK